MSTWLFMLSALAFAATPTFEVTPVALPASNPFVDWTRVGTLPTGGDSPFKPDVAVACKRGAGCRLQDASGHTAAVSFTRREQVIRFQPKAGVSYTDLAAPIGEWVAVWKLGNKVWTDDWLAPV